MPIAGGRQAHTFEKGLNRDADFRLKPKGTYHHALNGIISDDDSVISFTTEKGTTIFSNFSAVFDALLINLPIVIGHVVIEETIIVFVISSNGAESAILKIESNGAYSILLGPAQLPNNALNFDVTKQIDVVARKIFGNQIVVYFTDDVNVPRRLNIDNIPTGNIDDILQQLALFTNFNISVTELQAISDTGGSVNTGVYQFAARVLSGTLEPGPFGIISGIIPIVDDLTSVGRDQFDGAPFDTQTTKSISIEVTNIDTSAEIIEVAVIYYQGSSAILKTEIFTRQTITGATMSFIYTQNEVPEPINAGEIAIEVARYNKAKCIEQKDNILFLSNLETAQDNNIALQQIANAIRVKLNVEEVSATFYNDYKGEQQTYDKKGYWRDEVYSFAFGVIYNNGATSFAYHIPAQSLGAAYTTVYTSAQIYPAIEPYVSTGLTGGIRHHQMPTFATSSTFVDGQQTIRILGLTFENIVIPTALKEEIAGYFILRQKRDKQQNRSIYGQGLGQRLTHYGKRVSPSYEFRDIALDADVEPVKTEYLDRSFLFGNTILSAETRVNWMHQMSPSYGTEFVNKLIAFHSPDIILGKINPTPATILQPVIGLQGTATIVPGQSNIAPESTVPEKRCQITAVDNVNVIPTFIRRYAAALRHLHAEYNSIITLDVNNGVQRTILKNEKIPPGNLGSVEIAGLTPEKEIFNFDGEGFQFLELDNDFQETIAPFDIGFQFSFVHVTAGRIIYPLFQIAIPPIKKILFNLKSVNSSQYGPISDAEFIMTGHTLDPDQTSINIFNGDCFITKFWFKVSGRHQYGVNIIGDGTGKFVVPFDTRGNGKTGAEFRASNSFFCESDVNPNYRHIAEYGVPYYKKVKPLSELTRTAGAPAGETDNDTITHGTTGALDFDPGKGHSDFYNILYSKENDVKLFFSTPLSVGTLVTNFPVRTMYSLKHIEGQTSDAYRVFLPANFHDIPAHTGEIWDTFVSNKLYLHTIYSLWRTFVNEREAITSTEGQVLVGTGSVFGHPSQQVFTAAGGYAGTRSQFAGIHTPYGYVFPDTIQGKVYLLGEQLKEISQDGMWKYFFNTMQLQADNPAYRGSRGVITAYDHEHKRLLISRTEPSADPSHLGGNDILIRFTLSYSFITQSWTSFHSYLPNAYITKSNFFSIDNGLNAGIIWQHNTGNPGYFYNAQQQPFEITFSINEHFNETKTVDNIVVIGRALRELDDVTIPDDGFNQIQVYNELQHTGIINLVTGNNVRYVEGQYNIVIPRNAVVDTNVDKFLSTNLNTTILFKDRIRDKFAVTRLIYNNLTGNKFTVSAIMSLFRKSPR